MGGLLATAYTIREEGEARRVANLFTITKHHREIWTLLVERPELSRILSSQVDLGREPITQSERLIVRFLVLHLASSFEAQKRRMYLTETNLREDVRDFFTLPIPNAVWQELRSFQDQDFVRFIDEALGAK